ncbi:Isochorismatase hydrolase [Stereum hirsutum FP-91666 SS1]|uniref:Isochorismatase hydrolase n=1 Tax=Stereum hirsutum (strain FP-91666) TaxID=721885 RepID=UPI0004409F84|nr:Isochorismatase hydrolase [Stereum hirsutum FP-91666 SS1]EIM89955.1 Isochorismatase hydrolase [Stereum hirsutum FP-91666 SS1]
MPNGTFGNVYNFWEGDTSSVDLTRGAGDGVSIKTSSGNSDTITITPNASALVIVDMQNFFIHPNLSSSSGGRDIVPATISTINAFRANNMKILWVQWGLTDLDLHTIAPSFLFTFGDGDSESTFGTEMGFINDNGTEVDMGRKLMRGSWNAQAWGELYDVQTAGIANGTDFYFNKNRLSGMWGDRTAMEQFLQDQGITTLFFGGVNTDQCVYGTLLDSAYKGYDTIFMTDLSATTSPSYATEMVVFNAGGLGWVANSSALLSALT